ncbi:MAG: zinc ribbon domain-containing protein [Parcubacteria group bacterium]|nr:zinc ribbon domain-containing protein [Parcubacteria group bacterium]
MKTKNEEPLNRKLSVYILVGAILIALLVILDMEKFAISGSVIVGVIFWIKHMYKESKEAQNFQTSNDVQEEEVKMPIDTSKESKKSQVPKFRKNSNGKLIVCTDVGEDEKPIEINHGIEIYAYLGNSASSESQYCSQCGQSIPTGGIYCPTCGKKLVSENTHQPSTTHNLDKKPNTTLWNIGSIFVFIFILLFFVGVMSPDTPNTTSSQSGSNSPDIINDDIDVFIQAKNFVKQGLKSPSTAVFPVLCDCVTKNGSVYTVSSFVDSQNSFGAMLRSNWTVIMSLEGDKWVLKRMVIGGEVVYDPVEAEKSKKETQKLKNEIDQQLKEIEDLQKQLIPN